jgi:hypothetical protein
MEVDHLTPMRTDLMALIDQTIHKISNIKPCTQGMTADGLGLKITLKAEKMVLIRGVNFNNVIALITGRASCNALKRPNRRIE